MKAIIFCMLLILSSSALALTGFLNGERTQGMNKYCYYSNGVVITINSISLCPLQVN
jgi:hypothetical protein